MHNLIKQNQYQINQLYQNKCNYEKSVECFSFQIILSQKNFEKVANTAIANSFPPQFNIQTLASIHTSIYKYNEENLLMYFSTFVDSVNTQIKNRTIRNIIKQIQYPIIDKLQNQYMSSIVMLYIYVKDVQYVKHSLFYGLIQSYFKSKPLIILKQSVTNEIYQEIQTIFNIEQNEQYLTIIPTDQQIQKILCDQDVLKLNDKIYLKDRKDKIYYPIICDEYRWMEANSILQAQVFQDDEFWTILQPDKQKRFFVIKAVMDMMQKTNYVYGCNLVFMNLDSDSIQAALTSTPPGVTQDYLGSVSLSQAYTILQCINWRNVVNITTLNNIHDENCKMKDNHMYICGIVTNKACRQQGLGQEIFKIVYSIIDQSEGGIYLENSKNKNLLFYDKVGLIPIGKYACTNQINNSSNIYIMVKDVNYQRQEEYDQKIKNKEICPDLIELKGTITFY